MKIVLLTTLSILTLLSTASASAQNITSKYAGCEDTNLAPPCIAADGTITYACDDARYEPTAWNPCSYLENGGYNVKMPTEDLTGAKAEEFKTNGAGNSTFDTYVGCEDTSQIAPCMEAGELIVYCDDPAFNESGITCVPSPQEWASFLPTCESVDYKASCAQETISSQRQALFTCDDPEFNFVKYPQGCITVTDQGEDTDKQANEDRKKKSSSDNKNSDGGDAYACRFAEAKIVESNKDLPVCKEKKLQENSDEYICDSDPSTTAPSCDDLLKEQEKENNNNNDYQEEFELPPEEEPEFEDEVTGNISSS